MLSMSETTPEPELDLTEYPIDDPRFEDQGEEPEEGEHA